MSSHSDTVKYRKDHVSSHCREPGVLLDDLCSGLTRLGNGTELRDRDRNDLHDYRSNEERIEAETGNADIAEGLEGHDVQKQSCIAPFGYRCRSTGVIDPGDRNEREQGKDRQDQKGKPHLLSEPGNLIAIRKSTH